MSGTEHPHIGSSLDDLLAEDGTLGAVAESALKKVLAWRLSRAIDERGLSKTEMARRMGTSRSALDRLLDPDHGNVTLATLDRAATAVGKRLRVELVDAKTGET